MRQGENMKQCLVFIVMFVVFGVTAGDIKTSDGTIYKNVVVEGVNPGGIDIGYTDANGNFILRGLKFTDLPSDIQKKYGYTPVASGHFEGKVNQYDSLEMDDVAKNAKNRVETIMKEIKSKFSGANIHIKPEDISYAVFGLRRSVKIMPLSTIRQGCIAEIQEVSSGKKINSKQIVLDGVSLPVGVAWSGFIYPTGIKANHDGVSDIPVFTGTAQRAINILNKYLNIYGSYAASQQSVTSPGIPADIQAPSQIIIPKDKNFGVVSDYGNKDEINMLEAKQQTANVPQIKNNNLNIPSDYGNPDDHKGQTDAVKTYYLPYYLAPEDNYEYSYYLGSYYPVDWYRKHSDGRPYPRPDDQNNVSRGSSSDAKVGNFYQSSGAGGR